MAYTPTVYTDDASSPDLDATNLNKSEQGIKLAHDIAEQAHDIAEQAHDIAEQAHDIAVPVDCSSRVAEYTGDGGGATVKDRAGNGNNLTATDITYVNGKYGKEMSFNGSTSYAQASSPVIGTTGTVAVRFKRSGDLGSLQFIYDNRKKTNGNGTALYFDASNVLFFSAREDDAITENYNLGTTIDETTNYHTLVIAWNGANIVSYIDNIASTRAQSVLVSGVVNTLVIGKFSFHSEGYFNGIISHFRYDSRIWTADESRAWSLNPISIDSRV